MSDIWQQFKSAGFETECDGKVSVKLWFTVWSLLTLIFASCLAQVQQKHFYLPQPSLCLCVRVCVCGYVPGTGKKATTWSLWFNNLICVNLCTYYLLTSYFHWTRLGLICDVEMWFYYVLAQHTWFL